MTGPAHIGKLLIIAGAVLLALGLLLTFSGKLPWIGRLPGDIVVERKNFTLYFPITTAILISVILSLVMWIFGRR